MRTPQRNKNNAAIICNVMDTRQSQLWLKLNAHSRCSHCRCSLSQIAVLCR